MIASVAGDVLVRRPDHVVIETAGGVGYRLAVSAETLRQVPAVGKPASLLSHLVVRDDALALYGFATEQERDLFLLLVSVQSVGPKVALAVLSGGSARDLTRALAAGDADRLQAVPGIGKRTAERIVVELREKAGASTAALTAAPGVGAGGSNTGVGGAGSDDPRRLAREGLLELGYGPVEADALLDGLAGDSAEELLAGALRAARAA